MNTKPAVEAQENAPLDATVANALVIKQGFVAPGSSIRKPVIVMANGHVVFALAENMQVGMKLTLEEWNRIADFVDGQLLEAHEAKVVEASWKPDWSTIPEPYNYYAIDESGRANIYVTKPDNTTWSDEWRNTQYGGYRSFAQVELPEGVKWRDTLCIRPGVSL